MGRFLVNGTPHDAKIVKLNPHQIGAALKTANYNGVSDFFFPIGKDTYVASLKSSPQPSKAYRIEFDGHFVEGVELHRPVTSTETMFSGGILGLLGGFVAAGLLFCGQAPVNGLHAFRNIAALVLSSMIGFALGAKGGVAFDQLRSRLSKPRDGLDAMKAFGKPA